jgi:Domain of unknown function (DUF4145)
MVLFCNECGALVEAVEEKRYLRDNPDDGPPYRVVTFLRCSSCQGPFVISQENQNGYELEEPVVLFPQLTRINPNLPKAIHAAFQEADACFRARAYTASAIMCRKTLEGLAAEHGIKGKPLVASLKELKESGVIESRLYEWADALRISGNEAAHDVNVTVSAEDARDLLEFSGAILEYVFTFRDRFDAFKKRRQSTGA